MKKLNIFAIFICLSLVNCTESPKQQYADVANISVVRQTGDTFAHEHSLSVSVPQNEISNSVQAIIDLCNKDRDNECTVLSSNFNVNNFSRGDVKIRIDPPGVNPMIQKASSFGKVTNLSTNVEDLAEVIADYDRRLEMLTTYRQKLQQLEKTASNNIDAMIKVTKELTQVQADIEKLTGENSYQKRRTQTDIINIILSSDRYSSFWSPISKSISDFGRNFSDGISSTITGAAYVIPWLIIVLPIFILLRVIWKKTKLK